MILWGGSLEHSAKGTTWDDHKYVTKKIVNGKTVYIYTNKEGTQTSGERVSRKDAEFNASWDMMKNKYNEKHKLYDMNHVHNYEKAQREHSDFNDAVNASREATANKRFGANGMPSQVASIIEKHADEKLDDLYKKYVKK